VVAGLAVAALAGGARRLEGLVQDVHSAGAVGPLVAIAGTAVLVLALVPRTVVAAAGGLLFGPVAGSAYVLVGACLGALVAFGAGRWLGRDVVVTHARAARVDRWITASGTAGVASARLLPVAPFGLVSYVCGASGLSTRAYLVGTLVGMIPGTVVYAGLGASAMAPGRPAFLVLLLCALALPLVALFVARRLRRGYRRVLP
jgi:uncharacterized membrane protein YdjX (TVP38/TMEM64 family)